jgi:hypothetical protein
MAGRDHDYTLRIAGMALERIKAPSRPADPPGYELWCSHASNRNPEMNRRSIASSARKGSCPLSISTKYTTKYTMNTCSSWMTRAGGETPR